MLNQIKATLSNTGRCTAVATAALLCSSAAWAISSSPNHQLGYAATDGGGGAASSASYSLQASAIGTSLHSGEMSSSSYGVASGTPVHDDDGDGLDSGVEQLVFMTNPTNSDTDGDLLGDGEEVISILTDPTLFDTDGDTLGDGEEVAGGSDPLNPFDPFGAIENVPVPVWALLMLGMGMVAIRRRMQSPHVS